MSRMPAGSRGLLLVSALMAIAALTGCSAGRADGESPALSLASVTAATPTESSDTPPVEPPPADLVTNHKQLVKLTDPNGFRVNIKESVADWQKVNRTQATELCDSDELSSTDWAATTVWAMRMSAEADFRSASVGSWDTGESEVVARFQTHADQSTSGLIRCSSAKNLPDDGLYQAGSFSYTYRGLTTDASTAAVTLFRLIPKTPKNPDGALKAKLKDSGSIVIGAIADPAIITRSVYMPEKFRTYYTKFGFLQTDGSTKRFTSGTEADLTECPNPITKVGWQIPAIGAFEAGTLKPSGSIKMCPRPKWVTGG